MLKTKLASVAAAAALSFGAIGSAQAMGIIAGDFKFTIDNYDSGTTGYGTAAIACLNNTAACDAAASSKAPGSVGSINTSADTMGIFSVGLITRISDGAVLFTKGTDGFLTGVFGNLADHTVGTSCNLGVCTTTTFSSGGVWALYQNTSDYNPTLGPTVAAGKDLNALLYPSITGGSLYLSGVFGAGVSSADSTATYQSAYNSSTIAGAGQAYLDITGGSAKTQYDTNTMTDPNGGKHDLFLDITYNDADGSARALGWTVTSSGQIKGNAVPEPGTMALAGLALLGAGLASRRRKS
ncbi:MAG: PEP-CTERM sorting domain-containing protein [Proteobacteria bacterium]|nr:PEP-CTERM sorting domain-containing protein [Pseudomonadota bacterium]MBS0494926.1 PEP-CTERM sorting domain-containing protein [Pseudomonadota bacterium]